MNENKNIIIAVILSVGILMGFQLFYETPRQKEMEKQAQIELTAPAPIASAPVSSPAALQVVAAKVPFETPYMKGSLNLRGGRIDDVILTKYHEKIEKTSPPVRLLSPAGTDQPYYSEFGWTSADPQVLTPTNDSIWTLAEGGTLTPDSPIRLTWDNGQGLLFERHISVDEHYVFHVRQRVTNHGTQTATLTPYGSIVRGGTPPVSDFFILYEGPIGYLDGKTREHTYKDLDTESATYKTTGGWVGMTDKYWLAALIPDQSHAFKSTFQSLKGDQNSPVYKTDYQGRALHVAPGTMVEDNCHFFAGAKSLELLDAYEKTLPAPHFDLAVDFGWFYFITKPIFYVLTYFHELLGNFGLAILLLTILMRGVFFPISSKAYRSMAQMRRLQPEIALLKERYGNDKMRFHEETMKFYKAHKINPVAGCLPFVVQIPVFFALYKVLFISLEMRHAPFYGWIHDLSAPDPTSLFNLFGLIPWTPPSFLIIGIWPILMGISMFIQQRLNPQPMDPVQEKIFLVLPLLFTVMLAQFPAGLVIYWTWSNVLAIGQQMLIAHMMNKNQTQGKKA